MDTWSSCARSFLLRCLQRNKHVCGSHRQTAYANAGSIVKGVRDRGGGWDGGRLADPTRVGRAERQVILDDMDLDLGNLTRSGNLIELQVRIHWNSCVAIQDAILIQGIRNALNYSSID